MTRTIDPRRSLPQPALALALAQTQRKPSGDAAGSLHPHAREMDVAGLAAPGRAPGWGGLAPSFVIHPIRSPLPCLAGRGLRARRS
jgi:hypothetical protein